MTGVTLHVRADSPPSRRPWPVLAAARHRMRLLPAACWFSSADPLGGARMRHSTGKPTKAEQSRFDRMKEMGICIACQLRGVQPDYPQHIEIHHLLSGGRRIGHMATVSLCQWHHRAVLPWGWGDAEALEELGPSLAKGSKPFRAAFGSDAELLTIQNSLLEGV